MKLKAVNKKYDFPRAPKNYRGLERYAPHYIERVDDDHKVNLLWDKYIHTSNLSSIISDLDLCWEVVGAYSELDPPEEFEIIEITTDNESPLTKQNTFLGYDLVTSGLGSSLLSYGLKIYYDALVDRWENKLSADDSYWIIKPLVQLVGEYFQSQLNENVLFDDFDLASYCLECMMALQTIRPNLYEGEGTTFVVAGIWLVEGTS